MLLSDFDYQLPPELIAQTPLEKRDNSRLLVLHRETGQLEHKHFYDLPDLLPEKVVVVINNSKVFKARLFGIFNQDKNKSEVFLLQKVGDNIWQCLTSPGRKFHPGKVITFISSDEKIKSANPLLGQVKKINADGTRLLEFNQEVESVLDHYGHVPLPPYIKKNTPLDRYQTIYAAKSGSVAAPTAGLHFTPETFAKLKQRDIAVAEITLHVGLGTFQPVKTEKLEEHIMHKENFTLSPETADFLNRKKREGYKILAVGTTTARVLETCSTIKPSSVETRLIASLQAQSGHTDLFIYPGYTFKFVDLMLTNFHLPKSTLLMLISAFASRELTKKAYDEAIKEQYRFYSFGDAMLIL